ncbi:MAG: alpha/beta fold hydrolase, partial [Kiloniellaceae bacterium]
YRERWLTAQDGLRLYIRDYGDPLAPGTPVLCLPGLTRNGRDFHVMATRLAAGRRVVCPDLRGRGRSEYAHDWRDYAARAVLDDVRHLMAAMNLHPIVVCGVSYGGLLAMALGALAPSTLAGVILDDIGPDMETGGTSRILDFVSQDRPEPDWASAVATMKATFPTLSFTSEADWRRFTEDTFREGEDGRLHFDFDTAITRPLRDDAAQIDLWPLFHALARVPVLVIRGGVSDLLSAATLERMIEAHPRLAHLTLPGVGHAPSLNEPESEHAIDDFLRQVDG